MQLHAGMLWQLGDFMLRLLLPQTAALRMRLQLLLPGHLLLQALAVRTVSAGLLLPGRLLPQAAAVRASIRRYCASPVAPDAVAENNNLSCADPALF